MSRGNGTIHINNGTYYLCCESDFHRNSLKIHISFNRVFHNNTKITAVVIIIIIIIIIRERSVLGAKIQGPPCFAGQAQVFGDRGTYFLQGGVSVRKCPSVPASQKGLFKGAKMTR